MNEDMSMYGMNPAIQGRNAAFAPLKAPEVSMPGSPQMPGAPIGAFANADAPSIEDLSRTGMMPQQPDETSGALSGAFSTDSAGSSGFGTMAPSVPGRTSQGMSALSGPSGFGNSRGGVYR